MTSHTRHISAATYLAAAIGLCDQFSKWWIINQVLQASHSVYVTPFFNIVLVWNKGVTFGLFNHGYSRYLPYFFVGIASIILFLLLRWLWHTTSMLVALALGLVIGGAIGNVIDRLRYGAVADFLDFHAYGYHWPSFNLADSAIVLGVGLLLLDSLVRGR